MEGFRPEQRPKDYANAYKPRSPATHTLNTETLPKSTSTKPTRRVLVSIRFNLPCYGRWRLTKFARQYPFLAIAMAAAILIGLGLLITATSFIFN